MKKFILLIGGVAVLVGLFLVVRPKSQTNPTNEQPQTEKLSQKVFNLKIENKKIVGDESIFTATEGDSISLKITSDEAEELHLHGYDRSVDLEPNVEAELNFTANLTGRFVFELENSKAELGTLEVQPK